MDLKEIKTSEYSIIIRHPWELARVSVISKILQPYLKNISHSAVLDMGCGDTFLVKKISEHHPSLHLFGIDTAFSDDEIKRFTDNRIILYKTTKDYMQSQPDPAGIILLLDVIEHIEEEILFLKDLLSKKIIADDTIIMITVPAFNKLFTSHDHFLGHYRRYSFRSLKKTVESSGMIYLAGGYFFSSLLPPRILQVIAECLIPPNNNQQKGIGGWKYGRVITNLIKYFLLSDFAITSFFNRAGIKIPGLSVYAICKKSA